MGFNSAFKGLRQLTRLCHIDDRPKSGGNKNKTSFSPDTELEALYSSEMLIPTHQAA